MRRVAQSAEHYPASNLQLSAKGSGGQTAFRVVQPLVTIAIPVKRNHILRAMGFWNPPLPMVESSCVDGRDFQAAIGSLANALVMLKAPSPVGRLWVCRPICV